LSDVLRGTVVGGSTLVAPAPVWDAVTAQAIAAERDAAEARGHARGLAEGRAEAVGEIVRLGQALEAAFADLRAEVAAQREAAVAADLDVARAVIDEVLGTAPPTDALQLLERVREVAAMLDDPTLEVRLHPEDRAVLTGAALDPRLSLVADPTVARGEASVDGTWGRADLRRRALRDAAVAQLAALHGEVPA
jgi:flagellar biosynthesis/type III secretory pathway protein FliH